MEVFPTGQTETKGVKQANEPKDASCIETEKPSSSRIFEKSKFGLSHFRLETCKSGQPWQTKEVASELSRNEFTSQFSLNSVWRNNIAD